MRPRRPALPLVIVALAALGCAAGGNVEAVEDAGTPDLPTLSSADADDVTPTSSPDSAIEGDVRAASDVASTPDVAVVAEEEVRLGREERRVLRRQPRRGAIFGEGQAQRRRRGNPR
jgi:hypothetical protein